MRQTTITQDEAGFGGDSWPLPIAESLELGEGTDLALLVLEVSAAVVLMAGGVALGWVGESLAWTAVTSVPGVALLGTAMHRRWFGC